MTLFLTGAFLVAVGIGIILWAQGKNTDGDAAHAAGTRQVLLSILVLLLVLAGGAMMAIAIF